MLLETKVWDLGVLVALGVLLLPGPFSCENKEMGACTLTHVCSHVCKHFQTWPSVL